MRERQTDRGRETQRDTEPEIEIQRQTERQGDRDTGKMSAHPHGVEERNNKGDRENTSAILPC